MASFHWRYSGVSSHSKALSIYYRFLIMCFIQGWTSLFLQLHQADEEGKYPCETLLGYAAISTMSSQQLSISSLSWVITRMVLPLRTSLFSLSAIRRIILPVKTAGWLIKNQYPSFEAFSKAIADYIDYYNNSRIQAKTKWMPPSKFREASMMEA